MDRVYYELGYETRMRITFATMAGFFFALAFVTLAIGTVLGGAIFIACGSGMMWLATNNRWFIRTHRKS